MNELSPFQARPLPAEDAEAYFAQVESLELADIRSARRWRTTAWWVAGGACLVATAACFALAALAPLHSVEWRLVRMDTTTGRVDEVASLKAAPKTEQESVTRYFAAQYIMARESYTADQATHNFDVVSLMSLPDEQHRYAAEVNASNKESPQVRLGHNGFVRAHVDFVFVQSLHTLTARVTLDEYQPGQVIPKEKHMNVGMDYEFRPDANMSNAARLINPLGFLVKTYTISPEVPK